MQQVNTPPNGGKIAFFYGLSIGLLLAVVSAVISLSNTFVLTGSGTIALSFVLLALNFLLGLAAYFVAGIQASKQTAKVGTGSIAGLWTGVFYGIISFGLSITLFFGVSLPKLMDAYARNPTTSSLTQGNYRLGLIIAGIGIEILGLLFAIGLGAGMGALGGLLGKHISKVAPIPVYPYPYPAQQYQGQPQGQPYQGQPYPSQPQGQPQGQPYPSQPQGQPYQGQPYPSQPQGQPYQGQPYPYPAQQVPPVGPIPSGAEGTDPNQSYSEHPH